MQHLEFCPGKHVTWNINQCDELKTLPNHIAQLTSVVSSVRLDALQNIFEEILAVKIEFCRAEQFSELLDGIKPLLGDIQSKEAEKVVSIIELLWAKRFDIIMSERTKIYALFKDKQLGRLMKEAFLNPQTPIYIKENLSYSISLWKCIENVEDSCFIPILDMIQSKLKEEEQYLLQHPNDINHESKWSKYGIQSLEVLLSAFGFYALISDNFQQEIARRDGIQIGLRYLKHQSIQVRIKAANLFRISSNKTIGSEFRKNNDCLAILNDSICNPQFKLVSYEGPMNISPVKHLPHLHTGLLNETGLCLNCDLQHSSNSTDDNYDMEYLFIQNQLCQIRNLIKNVDETAKTVCKQLKLRTKNEDQNAEILLNINQNTNEIMQTTKFIDPLSKIILYMKHPYSIIRKIATQTIYFIFEKCEKDWIIQEIGEIQKRKQIKQVELKIKSQSTNELVKTVNDKEMQVKCNISAIPIIFDSFHHQNRDDHYCFSTWSIIVLLRRLYEFINEEEEEKAKKILENEESDVQVECLECGQIIPFGRFLLHMKSHNALQDIHYEINSESKYDDVENNSAYQSLKGFLEDIEEDGLYETIQSLNFQDYQYGRNTAIYFHKVFNHLIKN